MSAVAIVSLDNAPFASSADAAAKAVASPEIPPFLKIAGLPLLSRQILTLLKNGAQKVWLVPGSYSEQARRLIEGDFRFKDQPIELVEGENGIGFATALAAAAKTPDADRVLVTGGNFLFGPGLVRHMSNGSVPAKPVRWDRETHFYGIPLAHLKDSAGAAHLFQNAHTLTDQDRPDAKDTFVRPVLSRQDVPAAKKAIFSIVTKPTSGWVSRNLNSQVSIPISKIVSEFPVTPNMLTVLATIVGIASAPLIAMGSRWGVLWGGFCFQMASALDRCDGEIARSKFQASEKGEWIDTIGDNITYVLFLIGLTIGTYRRTEKEFVLYLGFGLLFMAVAALGTMYRYLLKNTNSGSLVAVYKDMEAKFEGKQKPLAYRFLDKIRFMGKRDFYSFAVFVLCAFNQLEAVFTAAIITVTCILVYVLSGKSRLPAAADKKA